MKHRAIVTLSPELLREALKLPTTVEVVSIRHDPFLDLFEILLSGAALPACPDGGVPKRIRLEEIQ